MTGYTELVGWVDVSREILTYSGEHFDVVSG